MNSRRVCCSKRYRLRRFSDGHVIINMFLLRLKIFVSRRSVRDERTKYECRTETREISAEKSNRFDPWAFNQRRRRTMGKVLKRPSWTNENGEK